MKTRLWLVACATPLVMVSGCKTSANQSETLTETAVPVATEAATKPGDPPKTCYDVTEFDGFNDFWLENTKSICAKELVRDGETVVFEFVFQQDFRILQTYRALQLEPKVPGSVQYISEGVVITLASTLKEETEKQEVLRTLSVAKQEENYRFVLSPAK